VLIKGGGMNRVGEKTNREKKGGKKKEKGKPKGL